MDPSPVTSIKSNQKFILSYKSEKNQITIEKSYTKIEDSSKDEELNHNFFNKNIPNMLLNEPSQNKVELQIDTLDNVLIFSPHPDDDILGACALIHKLLLQKKNMKIVYMTSGKSAGGPDLRKNEAIKAVEVLGGSADNLIFINMPFYEKSDRKVTEDDSTYLFDFLNKHKSDNIFICADIFDPHLTHRKCYETLLTVLQDKSTSYIQAYFYYSIWYIPKEDEYSHIVPYDFSMYKLKVNSMLEHKSQFETKFMGNDPRPFYQRAISRDASFGKKFNYQFCEVFYMLKRNT